MTPPLDRLERAARDLLDSLIGQPEHRVHYLVSCLRLDALRAALAAEREGGTGEAVAWGAHRKDEADFVHVVAVKRSADELAERGWIIVPLYAAPPEQESKPAEAGEGCPRCGRAPNQPWPDHAATPSMLCTDPFHAAPKHDDDVGLRALLKEAGYDRSKRAGPTGDPEPPTEFAYDWASSALDVALIERRKSPMGGQSYWALAKEFDKAIEKLLLGKCPKCTGNQAKTSGNYIPCSHQGGVS